MGTVLLVSDVCPLSNENTFLDLWWTNSSIEIQILQSTKKKAPNVLADRRTVSHYPDTRCCNVTLQKNGFLSPASSQTFNESLFVHDKVNMKSLELIEIDPKILHLVEDYLSMQSFNNHLFVMRKLSLHKNVLTAKYYSIYDVE